MDNRKVVFWCTLTFSVLLELYVRLSTPSVFESYPPIDNYMHFFWGLNIFLFLVIYRRWDAKDALLGVIVWQMAWETIEMVGDKLTSQPDYMADHLFFDGIIDTIMDAAGAVLGWIIIRILGTTDTAPARAHTWLVMYTFAMIPMIVLGSLATIVRGSSADWFAVIWILAAVPATVWFVRR